MSWLSRSVCALSLLALGVLAAFSWPEWLRAVGVEVGGLPDAVPRAQRAAERSAALDAARIDILQQLKEKERLVFELARQKVSLFEAARRFRELRPDPPDRWEEAVAAERGSSAGERLCRWVIRYAEAILKDSGTDPAPVVARLEAELAAHLARHGTVVLPGRRGPPPMPPGAAPPAGEGQN
jgi:hypothetical protein